MVSKKYKKKLLLVPSALNKKVLGDLLPFIEYYRDSFEINLIARDLGSKYIEKDGYKIVDALSEYADYLKYTSDYVIDAGSLRSHFKVGKNQKWISVWHGIPYKTMFLDFDKGSLKDILNYSDAYDVMISTSPYYTNTFLRSAMMYEGEIKEIGSARMDSLVRAKDSDKNIIKKKLGIPVDKKIILYAPTFREIGKFALPFKPETLIDCYSEDSVFITKLHYLCDLEGTYNSVIDCTQSSSVNELLIIADILISDYSSLILDYAILNKPIILFQYDQDEYFKSRSVYFDFSDYIEEKQIVTSEKDLYEVMNLELNSNNKKVIDYFYPYEKGNSTERIVNAINLNKDIRLINEIIFLVNDLNEIGGVHSFIKNMATFYKLKYNAKIIVIAINEFSVSNTSNVLFESENFDFLLSNELNRAACKAILKNTDGYIISTQFKAHQFFQKNIIDKNCILMFHGDVKDILNKKYYNNHLEFLNSQKIYNYKKLVLLSKNNLELLENNIEKTIEDRLTFINNSCQFNYNFVENREMNSFAYVGRLASDKNPLSLIKLGKIINKENLNIKINVYGEGPLKAGLESEIISNELMEIIILKGFSTDIKEIYENNCAMIMVSETEGYPLAILEAYSFGKPVIAFNTFTSATELIKHGKTGYLVEKNDYNDFIKKMFEVSKIESKDIRNIFEKYCNDIVFNKWNKLFLDVESKKSVVEPLKAEKEKKNFKNFIKKIRKKTYSHFSKVFPNLSHNSLYIYQEKKNLDYLRKKNFNPLVSIIIPCYNAESTIKETVKSVLKQKYSNLEVIVIEDGSEFTSENQLYELNDKRIRYFKKENSGPGLTRNYGLEKSQGEFIFFLDSDDLMYRGALSNMLKFLKENNLSVVSAITMRRNNKTNEESLWMKNFYKKTRIDDISSRVKIYDDALATNKLYKKSIITENEIYFPDGLYEDKVFTTKLYSKVDKIGILNKIVYVWNVAGADTSISTSKNASNMKERVLSINRLWAYLPEYRKPSTFAYFINHDLLIYILEFKGYSEDDKRQIFELACTFVAKYGKYYYPKLINNPQNSRVYKYIISKDYSSFVKIANIMSENHYKNIVKSTSN